MDRREKVLKYIQKDVCGVEIGPSFNPFAPKKEGFNVEIIDYLDRDQLIEKYKIHNLNIDNIEEVDFVWSGETYPELTGKTNYYDWIIASHMIEHTPDLISYLKECETILKDDGVLSLVIPDKRFCFDHFRPITSISRIIDSHIQQNKIHTAGTVAEYFLNIVSKNEIIAWFSKYDGNYKFVHGLEEAVLGIKSVEEQKAYLDVHNWCFVPHSFRLIIKDLFDLGFISFKEVDFFDTDGCEFYITLSKNGKGINHSRLELLEIIQNEMAQDM